MKSVENEVSQSICRTSRVHGPDIAGAKVEGDTQAVFDEQDTCRV
jgi:hypothetical protein